MSEDMQTPADEVAENEAPANDVSESEARVLELETENGAIKDQLLRNMAEMENLRKRTEKQIADERAYAIEKFAKDLLSVSDNMSRALEALTPDAKAELSTPGQNLLEGVEITQKELHAALARNGVSAIDAAPGATFDPNLHQAVSQIPLEFPAGAVASTFMTGWRIGDRTLRAAMVAVSAGGASPAGGSEDSSSPDETV